MTELRFPTIHLNGTSKEQLLEQYISACSALREALGTMASIYPNGRDYPTGGINEAMEQHSNRMAKLRSVLAEVEQMAEHVA